MLSLDKSVETQKIISRFIKRITSQFLDLIILAHFRNEFFSGYDVITFVHKEFGFLLSSGTIYSTLYSMERKNLVTSSFVNGKRIFKVTEKGKLVLEVTTSSDETEAFMKRIMKG